MKRLALLISATNFGFASVALTGRALQAAELAAFADQKIPDADWDYWHGQVNDARQRALTADSGPSESEKAAAANQKK